MKKIFARVAHLFSYSKMSSFVKVQKKIVKMMEEDEFLGCISCMSSKNLFDLFSVYEDNGETYASMFKTCFDVLVSICSTRFTFLQFKAK